MTDDSALLASVRAQHRGTCPAVFGYRKATEKKDTGERKDSFADESTGNGSRVMGRPTGQQIADHIDAALQPHALDIAVHQHLCAAADAVVDGVGVAVVEGGAGVLPVGLRCGCDVARIAINDELVAPHGAGKHIRAVAPAECALRRRRGRKSIAERWRQPTGLQAHHR